MLTSVKHARLNSIKLVTCSSRHSDKLVLWFKNRHPRNPTLTLPRCLRRREAWGFCVWQWPAKRGRWAGTGEQVPWRAWLAGAKGGTSMCDQYHYTELNRARFKGWKRKTKWEEAKNMFYAGPRSPELDINMCYIRSMGLIKQSP